MELALTTLLLLPGVVSLAIATGRRNRAIAPRDLPAAIVAILGFALLNFAIAALLCSLYPGVPRFGPSIAAALTGAQSESVTRENVISSLFQWSERNGFALTYLSAATIGTGAFGAFFYGRLLQVIARREASDLNLRDDRWKVGRWFDWVLNRFGITNFAIARGASYWLIVEQTAKLLAEKEPEVYADVVQGDDRTLFAGQVVQVITSRSGETLSVVLKKAQRYRRNEYGSADPTTGERRLLKAGGWKKIGDSEAFYMRGDCIHNISYRIYSDPARAGYTRAFRDGNQWSFETFLVEVLKTDPKFRTRKQGIGGHDTGEHESGQGRHRQTGHRQAKLRQAKLRQAKLRQAKLRQAKLSQAKLRRARLRRAGIRTARERAIATGPSEA